MKNQFNSIKTLLTVFALVFGFMSATLAQERSETIEQDIRVKDGRNSVVLKNGLGTLTFFVRNSEVVNASVQDAAGKLLRFEASDESESGAPNPTPCKQCARYIYNKETMSVIILCMPCNISAGVGPQPAFMKYIRRSKTTEAN